MQGLWYSSNTRPWHGRVASAILARSTDFSGAYSSVAEQGIRIAQTAVQFRLGPPRFDVFLGFAHGKGLGGIAHANEKVFLIVAVMEVSRSVTFRHRD